MRAYGYVDDPNAWVDPWGLSGKVATPLCGDGETENNDRSKSKPKRYDGPKPKYHVNPAHVKHSPSYNPKKTPLPNDAADVFKNAVPDDPSIPKNWYGRNDDGKIYRFSNGNDGTAHFSGIDGEGDGTRNMKSYAKQRLERGRP